MTVQYDLLPRLQVRGDVIAKWVDHMCKQPAFKAHTVAAKATAAYAAADVHARVVRTLAQSACAPENAEEEAAME